MKHKPLDDGEMQELIWAAYPERFNEENDPEGELALAFASEIEGFDEIADLLGRVVMLTIPQQSALTGRNFHALGTVIPTESSVIMRAAVKREFKP